MWASAAATWSAAAGRLAGSFSSRRSTSRLSGSGMSRLRVTGGAGISSQCIRTMAMESAMNGVSPLHRMSFASIAYQQLPLGG